MYGLLSQSEPGVVLFAAQSGLLGFWSAAWPYLLMVLGFSVIIFVHELGHFLAAKWAGVRVERFAIGFGREVSGFTWGETRYSFNILPLGGYVKMLGQEDFDDKSNELLFKDDPRSFINKSVSRRMAIVSAGVVMNVLFAKCMEKTSFTIKDDTYQNKKKDTEQFKRTYSYILRDVWFNTFKLCLYLMLPLAILLVLFGIIYFRFRRDVTITEKLSLKKILLIALGISFILCLSINLLADYHAEVLSYLAGTEGFIPFFLVCLSFVMQLFIAFLCYTVFFLLINIIK